MSTYLTLYNTWLPRTIFMQQIFIRSTTTTATAKKISDGTLKQRSASRFSLKIARFLYLKERIKPDTTKQTIVPLSTHAHYAKSESDEDIHEISRNFLQSLEPEQRRILLDELNQAEHFSSSSTTSTPINEVTVLPSQLAIVFFETGLPYIGFGFVDNFVMLVAGETIETFFGAAFCISTMAAAGLGNAVSDVLGIGLADRIERTCGRFFAFLGINSPKLTSSQWRLRPVQLTQLMSKIICIFVGCLLGMCPLLFRDTSAKKNAINDKDND